ncbi:MAG TPA: hypothetical protein VMA30_23075 [Xanthobacteraceae bacterium]|nr:hypothetical protein [Xanthobacteraceae bacterium]
MVDQSMISVPADRTAIDLGRTQFRNAQGRAAGRSRWARVNCADTKSKIVRRPRVLGDEIGCDIARAAHIRAVP